MREREIEIERERGKQRGGDEERRGCREERVQRGEGAERRRCREERVQRGGDGRMGKGCVRGKTGDIRMQYAHIWSCLFFLQFYYFYLPLFIFESNYFLKNFIMWKEYVYCISFNLEKSFNSSYKKCLFYMCFCCVLLEH